MGPGQLALDLLDGPRACEGLLEEQDQVTESVVFALGSGTGIFLVRHGRFTLLCSGPGVGFQPAPGPLVGYGCRAA